MYIFTDGSCLGNGASSSANGGIGIIIKQGSKELVRISKGYTNTTNNRMEMLAFIEALKYLKEHSKAHLKINMCLDSQYVLKGTTEWLQGWKKKNWKNSAKKDVLNKDLWMQIDTLVYQEDIGKNIHWDWVKGHNGHIENEICDELAKAGAHNPTQKDQ
ncbi:MAG: ribonuclease HI [Psittacicella sp.]